MDNYKLNEVKNIIDNNLLEPEVLENILKSSTRRIETYDDQESLDILKYLVTCDIIPRDTKEHINKYLAEYNTCKIENNSKLEEERVGFNKIMFMYIMIVILLIVLIIILYLRGRK